jgi:histidinol-phosphate aminotransferase
VYERLRAGGVLARWFSGPRLEGGIRVSIGTDEDMDRFLELLGAG